MYQLRLTGRLLADAHEQLSDAATSLSLAVPVSAPSAPPSPTTSGCSLKAVDRELLAVEVTLSRLAGRAG